MGHSFNSTFLPSQTMQSFSPTLPVELQFSQPSNSILKLNSVISRMLPSSITLTFKLFAFLKIDNFIFSSFGCYIYIIPSLLLYDYRLVQFLVLLLHESLIIALFVLSIFRSIFRLFVF